MKQLYFGDNLDVMKELHQKHPKGFIDLIYIDPPFNSKRNYNILYEDIEMEDTQAQKQAFADTWSNVSYYDTLNELADIDLDIHRFLTMLDKLSNISKSAVSYLTTMAIRIIYMHRLLKDTGSFYLHCDPNMSHYLKILCDLIFTGNNFRNEITWKRTFAHGDAKRFSNVADVILYYVKSSNFIWFNQKKEYDTEYINRYYNNIDDKGKRYALDSLVKPKGSEGYFYDLLGCPTPPNGWRMPLEKANQWIKEDKIQIPQRGKTPRYKRYLEDMEGLPITNIWYDIPPINSQAKEALGYPTQKPEALLERIIKASSNEGDLVADFFCGCGTTIAVAEKLNRRWLGVDISHLAVRLIVKRLSDPYEGEIKQRIINSIEINGLPKDIASAKELAQTEKKGRLKFQDWIIEVMISGVANPKKTADGGWDGHLTYTKQDNKRGIGLIEVKSGNVNVKNVREFIQVVKSQNADMGLFVCFADQVTKPMQEAARAEGYIKGWQIDKIQIVTVDDLLDANYLVRLPGMAEQTTFKKNVVKEKKNDDQGAITFS